MRQRALVVLRNETRQDQRTAARVAGAQAFTPKPVRPADPVGAVQHLRHRESVKPTCPQH